jgi:Flp pilus assembly protein CpaB
VPLIAGILLTTTAILLARSRIEAARLDVIGKSRPTEIVVASRSIRVGEIFSTGNLAKKAIPVSGTGKRNVPASDFNLLLNARSKGEIEPGEPVLWTDVDEPFEVDGFSLAVARGRRALTLEAGPTDSFSGLVRTGDRVDLLCKPTNAWIRDIEVLAVDRSYNRSGAREQDDVSTLTLSVSVDEGNRLAECKQDGTVTWFLRNPADNMVSSVGKRPLSPPPVEIWKGGIPQSSVFSPGVIR